MSGTPRTIAPVIVSCYNGTGAVIAANRQVMPDTTYDGGIKYPTATTDPLLGATCAEIADGEWGDVQIAGVALVAAHAAFSTPMTKVMSTAATGRAVAFSAGSGVNAQNGGIAMNTALAQDDLLEVMLAGPGIVEQGA